MRVRLLALALFLATGSHASAIILAGTGETDPKCAEELKRWESELDTRAVVLVHTPFGVSASGILLKGGTHILTAAHVTSCIRPEQFKNGLITFANASGQRRHWKSVQIHPAGKTVRLRQIWDAALIELDEPIGEDEVPGLSLASSVGKPGQLIAITGFGHRGTGQLGGYEQPGVFVLGFNFLDSRLTAEQCRDFQLVEGNWPIWLHQFDAEGKLGAKEAHFGTGDSGGAGLILDKQGHTLLLSLNLARHRGSSDADHRLNGSLGEIGLSLDVQALLPWLQNILPNF